jgi:carboxyl-terminal processing protease
MMKNMLKKIRWYYLLVAVVAVSFLSFRVTDNYFEISKNLEIFAGVFREINTYYVDGIDAGKLTKTAIDEMLKTLDPYTNFISEAEAEDFRVQMTGQYGGIGAQISQKGEYVMVTEPYENYPAQKEDLRPGDIITEVEGKSTRGKTTADVSKLLKGQPGTKVTLTIQRDGKEIAKAITREEIKVKNVTYYGMVNDRTGYIKLQGFTNDAGKEVRNALTELKRNPGLSQVILDLRGNPGGLLYEAINVVNVFVPIGQEVVSTKGKVKEWEKTYRTLDAPVDAEIPLVVLTNRSSASASEIVSGTIQDLDRGVIVGTRSFGKGLVQSARPLNYNTQIKITTAKYYTPSGRCIQALDYSHRNEDGSVGAIPDSLKKEFRTRTGRKVFDGGGIDPDIPVTHKAWAPITSSLVNKMLIFDYATYYRNHHDQITAAKDFTFTDADFSDFKKFISDKDYDYSTQTEKEMEELKKKAESEKYYDAIKTQYEALKNQVKHDKQADIDKNKEEISSLLEEEIVRRYYYQKGHFESGFDHDDDIRAALKVFDDKAYYGSLLKPVAKK